MTSMGRWRLGRGSGTSVPVACERAPHLRAGAAEAAAAAAALTGPARSTRWLKASSTSGCLRTRLLNSENVTAPPALPLTRPSRARMAAVPASSPSLPGRQSTRRRRPASRRASGAPASTCQENLMASSRRSGVPSRAAPITSSPASHSRRSTRPVSSTSRRWKAAVSASQRSVAAAGSSETPPASAAHRSQAAPPATRSHWSSVSPARCASASGTISA
mmetsp:Transcript_2748/g.9016  ORF Transcript_2748/g.9016 Transcript_2748/m.9016 type:complete len:219 (+) Transcript_2748:1320-1976(+)